MSIQSEIDRIEGAKAELSAWLTDNGQTVPEGAKIEAMVELLKLYTTDVTAEDLGALPISGGTMTGTLVASNADTSTQAVRNIYAGTEDLTGGESELPTGVIYIMYE